MPTNPEQPMPDDFTFQADTLSEPATEVVAPEKTEAPKTKDEIAAEQERIQQEMQTKLNKEKLVHHLLIAFKNLKNSELKGDNAPQETVAQNNLNLDFGSPIIVGAGFEETVGIGQSVEETINAPNLEKPVVAETKPAPTAPEYFYIEDSENQGISKDQGAILDNKVQESVRQAEAEFEGKIKNGEKIEKGQFVVREIGGHLMSELWQKNYEKVFSALSAEQQKEFGELIKGKNILKNEEIRDLLVAGFNLEDIKSVKYAHWWSSKIRSNLFDSPLSEAEAEKRISDLIKNKKQQMLEEEWDRQHNEFVIQKSREEMKKFVEEYEERNFAPEMEFQQKLPESNNIIITDEEIKEVEKNKDFKISNESKDVIEKLKGNIDTVEDIKNALGILQSEENKYRDLAFEIDAIDNDIEKGQKMLELEAKRDEHKKLAKAMVELFEIITEKNVYELAQQRVGKKLNIGTAIYAIIKETAEPFRKLSQEEKNEIDKLYPFSQEKKQTKKRSSKNKKK